MSDKPVKRRGGWPKRDPKPGERVAMSFRVTPYIKARIEDAAKTSGRSESQEVEFRLERSFHTQQLLTEALELTFGSQLGGILFTIGGAIKTWGPSWAMGNSQTIDPRQTFLNDPYAYDQSVKAIERILQVLRPPGDPSPQPSVPQALPTGGEIADSILTDLLSDPPEPALNYDRWRPLARQMLGPSMVDRINAYPDEEPDAEKSE